jgi:hypothetical protein
VRTLLSDSFVHPYHVGINRKLCRQTLYLLTRQSSAAHPSASLKKKKEKKGEVATTLATSHATRQRKQEGVALVYHRYTSYTTPQTTAIMSSL